MQHLRGRSRARSTAAAVVALVAPLLVVQASTQAATGPASRTAVREAGSQVAAPVPDLTWEPCAHATLECASALVPLDYDTPQGATTRIFMSKRAATDPAHKIGTLFV